MKELTLNETASVSGGVWGMIIKGVIIGGVIVYTQFINPPVCK